MLSKYIWAKVTYIEYFKNKDTIKNTNVPCFSGLTFLDKDLTFLEIFDTRHKKLINIEIGFYNI